MCGICGVIPEDPSWIPERAMIEKMNRVLRHRGPDAENFWLTEGAGLAHQRLSVIDLASGAQPMQSQDGRFCIVFNGEIYNFKELRRDLESRGFKFRTSSDTEVLLNLYIQKGEGCLLDLIGMFSFAIWDSREKKLFAARDRLGKKPFFYSKFNRFFYFASEIKAILQIPDFPRRVRSESVASYFCLTYTPYPATIYEEIYELPPAHSLVVKNGDVKISQYWHPDFEKKLNLNIQEASEHLWELLKEATRLRMISDVPLGVFLSGGIDSSLVVALMSELKQPIKTFSIGFKEADHNELPYAKLVADRFKTDHHEYVVKAKELSLLPEIVRCHDQPFSDSSALPSYIISRIVKQHVTVVLNGDGSDENFCGYPRFQRLKAYSNLLQNPLVKPLISFLDSRLDARRDMSAKHSKWKKICRYLIQGNAESVYSHYMTQFDEPLRKELFSEDLQRSLQGFQPDSFLSDFYEEFPEPDKMDRFLHLELLTYLPCDLLAKMDRATMAHGVEARSPFLDHRVVEFACRLPFSYKLRGNQLKHVLKNMACKRLPDQILKKRKWGFAIPVSRWFREDLKSYIREILLDHQTLKRPYFNPRTIKRLIDEHQSSRADHGHKLWSLLFFELWHRMYIDKESREAAQCTL